MCGNGARLPGIECGFMTALTPAQARALDHARALLAEDNAEDTLGDPDWHRMCRLALRDILAAFDEKGGG